MEWIKASEQPLPRTMTVIIWYQADYEFGWFREGKWWIHKDNKWSCIVDQNNVTHWCYLNRPKN